MSLRKVTTVALAMSFLCGQVSYAAEPVLVAIGSISGAYEDFATQTAGLTRGATTSQRAISPSVVSSYARSTWFVPSRNRVE